MSGWKPVAPVTPGMNDLCLDVKKDIEDMAHTTFVIYNPLSFAYQILEAVNYVVKVGIGGDQCVHAMISEALPHGGKVTVLRIQYPKTVADPLVSF